MSIKYDSTELQNATYVPRYIKHETSPERMINSLKLARQDGEVIVDDTMAVKYIDIAGVLIGSSQSDLETKIDAFKELIARKDKNLDISWAGGTRRYVCRSINHEFNRDFFHILHVPYSIRFFVPTGSGKDTSSTNILNKTGATAITATTSTAAVTFAGSYKPKPIHRITINTRGNADVIRVENTDTGDYMDVDLLEADGTGFNNGDYFEIDEENQTVKKNGTTSLNYRGKFPSVIVGVNNLKVTVIGSDSTLDINIASAGFGLANFVEGGSVSVPRGYQSFIPTQSGRIRFITPYVAKYQTGSLGGELRFYIREDDNGKPGDYVVGGSNKFAIAYASITDSTLQEVNAAYSSTDTDRPFLIKGKRYWIELSPDGISGGSGSDFYVWATSNVPSDYPYGKAMFYVSSYIDGYADAGEAAGGIPGQFDMAVKIYRGSNGGAANHNIDWKIDYVKKYL